MPFLNRISIKQHFLQDCIVPSDVSDQPAQTRRLIKVFAMHSVDSQCSIAFSDEQTFL